MHDHVLVVKMGSFVFWLVATAMERSVKIVRWHQKMSETFSNYLNLLCEIIYYNTSFGLTSMTIFEVTLE